MKLKTIEFYFCSEEDFDFMYLEAFLHGYKTRREIKSRYNHVKAAVRCLSRELEVLEQTVHELDTRFSEVKFD